MVFENDCKIVQLSHCHRTASILSKNMLNRYLTTYITRNTKKQEKLLMQYRGVFAVLIG